MTQDQMEAALKKIEDGVQAITTSEGFRAFLSSLQKFWNYSANNQMLIWSQMPTATRVNSFKRWKELKRSVKKGEKGLWIFVPIPYQRSVEDADGKERMVKGVTFKIGYVFDISQTEGEPLPEPPDFNWSTEVGPEYVPYTEALIRAIIGEGVAFEYGDTGEALGWFQPSTNKIRIQTDTAPNSLRLLRTLVHEFAHALAHHKDNGEDRSQCETIAECATYIVLDHYGFDMSGESFPYLAGWAKDVAVLKAMANRSITVAKLVSDKLESQLKGEPIGVTQQLAA